MKRNSDVSLAVLTAVIALGALVKGASALPQGTPTPTPQAPPAQGQPEKPAPKAPASTEKVQIVFLGNANCPVDEKPVNRDKFVEVEGQRVYVCSDACESKLKKDPAAATSALAKAYPTATPISSKECFCGKEVEKGHEVDATFQGHKVALCCANCASEFKKAPATAIALMMHPTAKDAKNATDPIDGKSIDSNVIAIYKGHLIHFSTFANATTFEKDPDPWMTKLKLSS
jgi:YHS domain-containing protein